MKPFTFPTFGAWLKTRRRACDVTQKELARAVGCAEITIRKIEADQLRPSASVETARARITGITGRAWKRTGRVNQARAAHSTRFALAHASARA